MSDNDTLLKGKRVLRAASFDEWRKAPRPNYNFQGKLDLEFPYSEYPRNHLYEYHSVQLPRQTSKQILDFWGEGRVVSELGLITGFPGAYNVNHQFQLVSNGADKDKKIPNRIPTIDYQTVSVKKYVSDGAFDIITLMGSPINDATAVEIARIISGDSHSQVVTYGFHESDKSITKLKRELDAKKLIILANYTLPHPLDEITEMEPALAFRPLNSVVSQARSNFINGEISSCAKVLCSLQRSSHDQNSAKEALSNFFNDGGVKNSCMIFALGYELDTTSDGKAVMNNYMNSNVVKIVRSDYTSLQLQSSNGKAANLCPYDKVKSWQQGFFGSSGYENDGDKLALVRADSTRSICEFKIRANYGATSYLCVTSVGSDSYQYAFFGTASYNQSYDDGQYFRLYPVSGGEKFKVQANFGETSYLCVDKVSTWEKAFFGTSEYISDNGYSAGETLKVIFH